MENPTQLAHRVDDILEHVNSLRLLVAKSESSSQDVYFTPRRTLAKEFNREMIRKLLANHGIHDANCDTIHNNYLAVFCTLIRINKAEYITYFTRVPESADRYLPFFNDARWSPQCSSFFKDFESAQWEFCAQDFRIGRLEDVQLLPNKIIPIIKRTLLHKGPDSKVEQIEIHPDHNYLNTAGTNATSTNTFVLKSYQAKHEALYSNEVNAYNKLKQPEIAGNIVRLYGSWNQNQTYCILLEFVKGGTLAELFCSSHPTNSQERLSFWRNLILIIEPLARLHQHTDPNDSRRLLEGVHQDIKPANILVEKGDTGLFFDYAFKLVDMGLAYFSSSDAKESRYRKKDGRGTQTYSAPECFRNENDHFEERSPSEAHPSKDIWSLGCVFSLALVWSVLGPDKLKSYQHSLEIATSQITYMKDSAYVGCFHDGREVLREVHAMHEQVVRACGRSDYIITELVPIIAEMLEEYPEERPSAMRLRRKCQQALDRATKLNFPSAFLTEAEAEPTALSQLPQKVPCTSQYRGLGIDGSHQKPFQLQASPAATERNFQSPRSSTRHSRPFCNEKNPIDPVMDDRSPTFRFSHWGDLSTRTDVGPSHHRAPGHCTSPAANFTSPASPNSAMQSPYLKRQTHSDRESITLNHHRESCSGTPAAHDTEVLPVLQSQSLACEKPQQVQRSPHATIDEVHDLIKKRKNGVPTKSPTLDDLRRLPSLQKRDQIFLIDNSISMQGYRSHVRKAFEVLAYLVKDADPDGMELHFTNWDVSGQQKNRAKLLRLLQSVPSKGQGGLESSLSKILDRCIRPGLLGRARRGVNIYIFTDGIWNREDNSLCGIDEAIMRTAAKMTTRNSIGIQFIQFGNNATGTRRLKMLDDGLKERNSMDIIDHTHVEGNVFKMLLGSIETFWDNQPSDADVSHRTSHESTQTRNAA